ncbi:hypothetical protein Tco_1326379 [Tanacetum coccineum]
MILEIWCLGFGNGGRLMVGRGGSMNFDAEMNTTSRNDRGFEVFWESNNGENLSSRVEENSSRGRLIQVKQSSYALVMAKMVKDLEASMIDFFALEMLPELVLDA